MTIKREIGRKLFHVHSLVYLAGYRLMGWPRILAPLACWVALVGAADFARLRFSVFKRLASSPLMREKEARGMSGLFYSAFGSLLMIAAFGTQPAAVSAGLACLALGDAAAGVVGSQWGRRRWPWSDKSLEGSTACFLVCCLATRAVGVPWPCAAAAAVAASAAEAAPLPLDDNLWVPMIAALAAWTAG